MSDNFNIRDFRNAGASAEDVAAAEKSNRLFNLSIIAIPVIAAVAGLGYKPLMDMRGQNVAAAQQAEIDYDARRRAESPLYAMMNPKTNADGLIDSNNLFGTSGSGGKKRSNEYARRSLNADEYLTRVDAKAYGFNAVEMETLKYERAIKAMSTCGHSDLRKFYTSNNDRAYARLKTQTDAAKQVRQAKQSEQMAKLNDSGLSKIETKGQAMAFVASGGAARHAANSANMFVGMQGMLGDMEKSKILTRKQGFNMKGCSRVRTLIQSGSMNVKANIR